MALAPRGEPNLSENQPDATDLSNSFDSTELFDLAKAAYLEFNDVADYVWKSPRLLEHEAKLEQWKLENYFPSDKKSAELRRKLEFRKIREVFPYLIAVGNLFNVVSLFENYLLLLGGFVQKRDGIRVDSAKGQGVTKLFNYFKDRGMSLGAIPLHEQIHAALKIRNCLIHAAGILLESHAEKELRRIQSSGIYLSPEHRKRRKMRGSPFDEVVITKTLIGDRLQVTNEYPFLLSGYVRDYFADLCLAADKAIV